MNTMHESTGNNGTVGLGQGLTDVDRALVEYLCRRLGVQVQTPVPDPIPLEQSSFTEQYVTLDQAAAMVRRSKRTLERYKKRHRVPMPAPHVKGGGGRPAFWAWDEIRPWLEQEFGFRLPEEFPTR